MLHTDAPCNTAAGGAQPTTAGAAALERPLAGGTEGGWSGWFEPDGMGKVGEEVGAGSGYARIDGLLNLGKGGLGVCNPPRGKLTGNSFETAAPLCFKGFVHGASCSTMIRAILAQMDRRSNSALRSVSLQF
jgi:hypothetical protein